MSTLHPMYTVRVAARVVFTGRVVILNPRTWRSRIEFGTMSATGAAFAETTRDTEPELVALLLKAGADPNSRIAPGTPR